jgi:hypothetical protein
MTRDEITAMARNCGWAKVGREMEYPVLTARLERFAALIVAAEREKVAAWMIERGYATGHGDTTEDLLKELEWQIAERMKSEGWRQCAAGQRTTQYCDLLELAVANEREACAKVCDVQIESGALSELEKYRAGFIADAIRARGNE